MAGLRQEQAVEVVDKATILDRLDTNPDVVSTPIPSGETLTFGFTSRSVGALATRVTTEGATVELRGILEVPELAKLYGIAKYTDPTLGPGRHLFVTTMGAYNGEHAEGYSMIIPGVGSARSYEANLDTEECRLKISPADKGRVALSYLGSHEDNQVNVYAVPANGNGIEIPTEMWVPPMDDKFMVWMGNTPPQQ